MDTMDPDVREHNEKQTARALNPAEKQAAEHAIKNAATLQRFAVGAFAPMSGPGDVMLITRPASADRLPVAVGPGMAGNVLTPEEATALGLHLISCAERVRRNRAEASANG
jgi:hypothetical protein